MIGSFHRGPPPHLLSYPVVASTASVEGLTWRVVGELLGEEQPLEHLDTLRKATCQGSVVYLKLHQGPQVTKFCMNGIPDYHDQKEQRESKSLVS